MTYTKQTWADGPTGGTPIDAARLSHMEDGIAAAGSVSWVESTADPADDPPGQVVLVLGPADSTAPSTPTALTATPASGQVTLSWTASTDAVGVAGYRIYRDGSLIVLANPDTDYVDTAVTNGVTYSYTVSAYDAAGNESVQTSAVTAVPHVPTPTIRSQAATNDGVTSGTTRSINLPATVNAGDILVVLGATESDSGYTFTVPAGWTKRLVHAPSGTFFCLTKTADGTEDGGTVVTTWNVGPSAVLAVAYAVYDISGEAPDATGTTGSVFGTSVAVPSLGTLASAAMVFGVGGKGGGATTTTPPAGWTEDLDAAQGPWTFDFAHVAKAAGTTVSGSWVFAASNGNTGGIAVAFE